MRKLTFKSENISKLYNRRTIFKDVAFSLNESVSFAITGKNGSGKSTLIKILCGVLTPNNGTISLDVDGKNIPLTDLYRYFGLVSPYLNLYEEFTAVENLSFIANVRGLSGESNEKCDVLLNDFGIYEHRKKEVRFYSSGMKQRLKYCAALLHDPAVLVLDEPSSNLDSSGIETVRTYMKRQQQTGILIFATNDADDLQFADSIYSIDREETKKQIA